MWSIWLYLQTRYTHEEIVKIYQINFYFRKLNSLIFANYYLLLRARCTMWKLYAKFIFFPSFFLHRSDLLFCSLLLVLAITVGYFGNHCLTNAPKTSDDAESQEATSLLLTATFVLGQASGSFLSFFVLKSIWCKFCCWWRPAEMILKKVLTVKKIYVYYVIIF